MGGNSFLGSRAEVYAGAAKAEPPGEGRGGSGGGGERVGALDVGGRLGVAVGDEVGASAAEGFGEVAVPADR